MKKNLLLIIIVFWVSSSYSQAPFSRGVNLTGWFQGNNPGQIQFTKFTKKDILQIKSLGCDVIRLPVNMHSMTSGTPSYILDPLYLSFQDSVVTWCEQLHVYLILDNHSFDPNVNTSSGIEDILIKVWSQLASHYKDRSDYLLYEILNEPHGISTTVWGTIQNQVINAIRAKDTRHTIVVGGSGFNSYTELKNLPVYSDPKLLYTFHFYDPFVFTHEGATWVSPSMAALSSVPFPFDASRMPACPADLKGTWVESSLNGYSGEGTVIHVKQLIDNAIAFKNSRNVNIFCGEFGVYIPNSINDDRAYWYGIVKQYLEDNNIPWTTWDYKGGFGLFNKGSNELFDHDLNVPLLQSLGLIVPSQTPFSILPDTTAVSLYSDFIGTNINDGSYSSGPINFYSTDLPNNGEYCLYWNGFKQYNAITFDFSPYKDLSKLFSGSYAIDFMIRGNFPGIKFDIRFVDTKTQTTGDHPWRMGATIDGSSAPWDMKWHHVHIPLTSFTERGSWDNNTWYNAEGKFDWKAVDKFEISTEYPCTATEKLWFDNIYITNLDTAIVRQTGVLSVEKNIDKSLFQMKVAPNPMKSSATISYNIPSESHISVCIYSIEGYKIRTILDETIPPGSYSIYWDGSSDSGVPVRAGLYLCVLKAPGNFVTCKIVKT